MDQISTTALIRNCVKEILKESGKTLTISDMKEQLKIKIDRSYTPGNLAGALSQLVSDPDYESVARGRYRYIGTPAEENHEDTELSESPEHRLYLLYKNTADKAAEILNELDFVNCTEEELQKLLKLREMVMKTREFQTELLRDEEK